MLTARQVETISKSGMHGDGDGLYLRVGPTGGKSWILRTVVFQKRREIGLGSVKLVSLAEARDKAREFGKVAREGGDPVAHSRRVSITLSIAVDKVYDNLVGAWSSDAHAKRWMSSMRNYVLPAYGDRPIETLGTRDVLEILTPVWSEKHDTAKRIKQRIAAVFDWAKGAGYYSNENPVNGLRKALPNIKYRAEHMESLPWQKLPAFVSRLREREGTSARCLEFLILTAARSGEARWSEIEGTVWHIPASRMKAGIAHKVPLCPEALNILKQVKGLDDELIFPSIKRSASRGSQEQSSVVFKSLLKRMNEDNFTIHGFRSTFRDWCSESEQAAREVAEAALAHTLGNKVERAYARSDLFERRKQVMANWGKYVLQY